MNLCKHGCGKKGVHKRIKGGWCCSKLSNQCEAVRKKNSIGVAKAHTDGRCVSFTDAHRAKGTKVTKEAILKDLFTEGVARSNHYLKSIIKEYNLLQQKCSECSIDYWNKKLITLELDHIDGCNNNCKITNLRLLCPNCHSQTSTFRGKGINNGLKKVSDEKLVESLRTSKNIRRALIGVGLSPRGANYARARALLSI